MANSNAGNLLKEYNFKVVLLGEPNVGKTSVITQAVDHTFLGSDYNPTIGVAFKTYLLRLEDKAIKMHLWDTAGQEKFRSLAKSYFRNAIGGILVYDVTSRESFDGLQSWLKDLEENASTHLSTILVGNKIDLEDARVISYTEAKEFADRHQLDFIETSAKTNVRIEETFNRLALSMARKQEEAETAKKQSAEIDTTVSFDDVNGNQNDSGCSC